MGYRGVLRRRGLALSAGILAVIAATVVLLAVEARPAGAVSSGGNLLQNPGAEAGPGGTDSSGAMPPPGWTVTGDFTAVQYGAAGGFPDSTVSASIGGGHNFFAGGNAAVSTATQTVDVSGSASAIDANTETVSLDGDLGGYATQDDSMTVIATFLSASGGALGSLTIGPVTQTDRNGLTTLLPRSGTSSAPAGDALDTGRHDRHRGSRAPTTMATPTTCRCRSAARQRAHRRRHRRRFCTRPRTSSR